MSKIDEIRKIYHDTKKKAYGKNISISLTDSQIKTLLDMLDERDKKLSIAREALECAQETMEIEGITCLQVEAALEKIR